MTAFAVAATVLALLAVGALLLGPRLVRQPADGVSQARSNAAVLRQQLAELEGERLLGLLDEAEFRRLRDELQQRLLAEAAQAAGVSPGSARPRRALLVYAAALPLAAAALYLQFGHPRLIGLAPGAAPAASAPANGEQVDGTLVQLEAHVAASPGDARAWVMLARLRMQRDQFAPAAVAYERALEASAKVARDPLIWCEYADAAGMTQGGRLAGRPRELIDRALALDATHPRALEMAGSAAYEAGDFHGAARYWRQLLTQLSADSSEHAELAAAVARAEQRARFTLPAS
ncbi:MAG: c-type cytochrome biogenesis protein CcmI [Burkholderiales bacterium]|nr:c-type cytochrome biogenesis protein CcmI [Burkholderiales bacterium]